MENAVDALHMAAGVLIFVLALTISISAFTQTRVTATTLLDRQDREYEYTYVEENFDSEGNAVTERIVGLESIVPSIYKAYKENYKIIFDDDGDTSNINARQILGDDNSNGGIYRRRDDAGDWVCVYSIDLQNEVLGNDTQKEQFLMAILYGKDYEEFNTVRTNFVDNLGIYLNEEGIYDKIISNGTALKESLGTYYQEEAPIGGVTDTDIDSVPDANKTLKRVITYSIS